MAAKRSKKTAILIVAIEIAVIVGFFVVKSRPVNPGEELAAAPFSAANEGGEAVQDLVLPFNAVYRLFGGSDTDNTLVCRFGNEPTYFEWVALKTVWTGDTAYMRELKDKIVSFPQTDTGYLWSWGDSTYWPTGKGDMHYDGLFRYVAAVDELTRWDGNTDLLNEKDATTMGDDTALDASQGKSVYEKCKAAMDYAYTALDGKDGLITITEKSVYLADGKTRFDKNADGEYVWNNTGRAGAAPSNYWDNLCFGNCDAYETMLYYHALVAMSHIETMRGDSAAAADYATHAELVKETFNETFWSEETGRYIACIDADGKRWDPGLTFLNTEALAHGLGDPEKAKSVFAWLDGERIVAGDTVTGTQIYNYTALLNTAKKRIATTEKLRFVPISNTVSIEDLSGDSTPWWFDLEGAIKVGEGENAAYGHHLENGGYIFYTLYYELTARAEYCGADSVAARVADLCKVYRFNGFDSDVGNWVEGMVGEFPESGIVSRAFVSALCGLDAGTDSFVIQPNLPSDVKTLGMDFVNIKGNTYAVKVTQDGFAVTGDKPLREDIVYCPDGDGEYTVVLTLADSTTEKLTLETDGGPLTIALKDKAVTSIRVDKVRYER